MVPTLLMDKKAKNDRSIKKMYVLELDTVYDYNLYHYFL